LISNDNTQAKQNAFYETKTNVRVSICLLHRKAWVLRKSFRRK